MKTINYIHFIYFLFLASASLMPFQLLAEPDPSPDSTSLKLEKPSLFSEWQQQEVLQLRLEADFSNLVATKNKGEYQSASLIVHPKTNNTYTTPVKIKARGKYRRRICDFPPLKIKLAEKTVEGIEVGNYKTFKLVTHCHNKTATKAYVLKEYLAYQLYQKLSKQSFRTQLVEITYIDQGKVISKMKRYGILIEDKDELEDRLNADDCDCGFQSTVKESQDVAARLALFQLMIGNSDWDFLAHRNIKVLQSRNDQSQIPVPYDFDFSGFVNPPYASPNPDFLVSSIFDRVMLGKDLDQASIDKAIQLFKEKEESIFRTIKDLKALSLEDRTYVRSYIREFYKLLESKLKWTHQKVLHSSFPEE